MVETQQKTAVAADVLFVDVEGTVKPTDPVWESLLAAVKRDPWLLLKAPRLFFGGRARAAALLADQAALAPQPPYRHRVLEFLQEERDGGRKIVLVAAGRPLWARQLADHLHLFDDIVEIDSQQARLAAIEDYCRLHGCERFAYLGASSDDLPIWREAAEAYVADPSPELAAKLQSGGRAAGVISHASGSQALAAVRALRPQQWLKNVLVLLPLLLSHQWSSGELVVATLLAFIAFCLCTSSVYVTNDLMDIEADRRHPKKRFRPFAAGDLPVAWGPPLALGLLAAAFALGIGLLNWQFVQVLAIYWVATTLYSFWFKRVVIADVMLLAGLYSLRILAGSEATGIEISKWLFAFSIFLFTSLAFVKRYAELQRLAGENAKEAGGRGYQVSDLSLIESMGPPSGYIAALVVTLYISSDQVTRLYSQVWPLWMICPLLVFWVSWVWLMAKRGKVSEDPIVFALTDRVSLMVWISAVVLVVIAASPW